MDNVTARINLVKSDLSVIKNGIKAKETALKTQKTVHSIFAVIACITGLLTVAALITTVFVVVFGFGLTSLMASGLSLWAIFAIFGGTTVLLIIASCIFCRVRRTSLKKKEMICAEIKILEQKKANLEKNLKILEKTKEILRQTEEDKKQTEIRKKELEKAGKLKTLGNKLLDYMQQWKKINGKSVLKIEEKDLENLIGKIKECKQELEELKDLGKKNEKIRKTFLGEILELLSEVEMKK